MSPEARALQALVHALVERDGAARTREIMADAAGLAMRPPTSDASPEAWHRGDVAFGFGASRLADELLEMIDGREMEIATMAATSKGKGT